ncbi:MAG: peptidoglycan-binding protein [Acidobacteriota bacterium]
MNPLYNDPTYIEPEPPPPPPPPPPPEPEPDVATTETVSTNPTPSTPDSAATDAASTSTPTDTVELASEPTLFAQADTTAATEAGAPILEQGAQGEDVRAVESVLDAVGYETGSVDGNYDNDTAFAVRRFQQDVGLPDTGDVDATTFEAIGTAANAYNAWLEQPLLADGQRGPEVEQLQYSLRVLGRDPGVIDGVYGNDTQYAVGRYQESVGIENTGTFDRQTAQALNADLNAYNEWLGEPLLERGATGDRVENLQLSLEYIGYEAGDIDGAYGNDTEFAVKRMQEDAGLPQTGTLDRRSAQVLDASVEARTEWLQTPVLEPGARGESVEWAQNVLNVYGYDTGGVDGAYGGDTTTAVQQFQRDTGLNETGVIDNATVLRLDDAARHYDNWLQEPVVAPGQTGEAVTWTQQVLAADGHYGGPIDGQYGGGTERAVSSYQASVGLPQTGTVDRRTATALSGTLRGLIAEQQAAAAAANQPLQISRDQVLGDISAAQQELTNAWVHHEEEIPKNLLQGAIDRLRGGDDQVKNIQRTMDRVSDLQGRVYDGTISPEAAYRELNSTMQGYYNEAARVYGTIARNADFGAGLTRGLRDGSAVALGVATGSPIPALLQSEATKLATTTSARVQGVDIPNESSTLMWTEAAINGQMPTLGDAEVVATAQRQAVKDAVISSLQGQYITARGATLAGGNPAAVPGAVTRATTEFAIGEGGVNVAATTIDAVRDGDLSQEDAERIRDEGIRSGINIVTAPVSSRIGSSTTNPAGQIGADIATNTAQTTVTTLATEGRLPTAEEYGNTIGNSASSSLGSVQNNNDVRSTTRPDGDAPVTTAAPVDADATPTTLINPDALITTPVDGDAPAAPTTLINPDAPITTPVDADASPTLTTPLQADMSGTTFDPDAPTTTGDVAAQPDRWFTQPEVTGGDPVVTTAYAVPLGPEPVRINDQPYHLLGVDPGSGDLVLRNSEAQPLRVTRDDLAHQNRGDADFDASAARNGDTVTYEGRPYTVEQAGGRFVSLRPEVDNPTVQVPLSDIDGGLQVRLESDPNALYRLEDSGDAGWQATPIDADGNATGETRSVTPDEVMGRFVPVQDNIPLMDAAEVDAQKFANDQVNNGSAVRFDAPLATDRVIDPRRGIGTADVQDVNTGDQSSLLNQVADQIRQTEPGDRIVLNTLRFDTEGGDNNAAAQNVIDATIEAAENGSPVTLVTNPTVPVQEYVTPETWSRMQPLVENGTISLREGLGDNADASLGEFNHSKTFVFPDSDTMIVSTNPVWIDKGKIDTNITVTGEGVQQYQDYVENYLSTGRVDEGRYQVVDQMRENGILVNDPITGSYNVAEGYFSAINDAQQGVDMYISDLRSESTAQLLVDKAETGVPVNLRVRGIDEPSQQVLLEAMRANPDLPLTVGVIMPKVETAGNAQQLVDLAESGMPITMDVNKIEPEAQAVIDAARAKNPDLPLELNVVDEPLNYYHGNYVIADGQTDRAEVVVGTAYFWDNQQSNALTPSYEMGLSLTGEDARSFIDQAEQMVETTQPAVPFRP